MNKNFFWATYLNVVVLHVCSIQRGGVDRVLQSPLFIGLAMVKGFQLFILFLQAGAIDGHWCCGTSWEEVISKASNLQLDELLVDGLLQEALLLNVDGAHQEVDADAKDEVNAEEP